MCRQNPRQGGEKQRKQRRCGRRKGRQQHTFPKEHPLDLPAPAPALSIVREFKTNGPVTKTLIPMAALDDIVGCIVFFITMAVVASSLSAGDLPAYMIALVILLPLLIDIAAGLLAGFVLKKERSRSATLLLLIALIVLASGLGFAFNTLVLPRPVLNFMLIGMAFSATFSNMIPQARLEQIMEGFNPILGVSMIVVILNLGAPLDYHLILGPACSPPSTFWPGRQANISAPISEPALQNPPKLSKNIWVLPFSPTPGFLWCLPASPFRF